MKKVYLFCSAGMSTSILASKMQEVANSHNLPIKVTAFSHNKLGEIVNLIVLIVFYLVHRLNIFMTKQWLTSDT